MRLLRYSINVTLDGCVDHRAGIAPDEEMHRHHTGNIARADALLFGRVVYGMMEEAWRPVAETGVRPEWMPAWMEPFARTIDAAKKYVVSSTLERVDWNTELLRGELGEAVRRLKREPGKGLFTGGVRLPLALAELGLIDEYEFVVHPKIAGHPHVRRPDRGPVRPGALAQLRGQPRRPVGLPRGVPRAGPRARGQDVHVPR